MSEAVFQIVRELLDRTSAAYRVVEHHETFTSQESADARGEPLEIGGKALLVKAGGDFVLAVLRASDKLDSRKLQQVLGGGKIRFATREELAAITGLVPGAGPPFGRPVFDVALYVDEAIRRNERIAFNAGLLTRSIVMPTADYFAAATPLFASFAA